MSKKVKLSKKEIEGLKEVLIAHIAWAKEAGLCTQCTYPYHDGLCECEWNKHRGVKTAERIGHDLIEAGENLNDL